MIGFGKISSFFSDVTDLLLKDGGTVFYKRLYENSLVELDYAKAGKQKIILGSVDGAYVSDQSWDPNSDYGKYVIEAAQIKANHDAARLVFAHAKIGNVFDIETMRVIKTFGKNSPEWQTNIDNARMALDHPTTAIKNFEPEAEENDTYTM